MHSSGTGRGKFESGNSELQIGVRQFDNRVNRVFGNFPTPALMSASAIGMVEYHVVFRGYPCVVLALIGIRRRKQSSETAPHLVDCRVQKGSSAKARWEGRSERGFLNIGSRPNIILSAIMTSTGTS